MANDKNEAPLKELNKNTYIHAMYSLFSFLEISKI
jgi:hypothetical protein